MNVIIIELSNISTNNSSNFSLWYKIVRLYPVVATLFREIAEDVVMLGYKVPANVSKTDYRALALI